MKLNEFEDYVEEEEKEITKKYLKSISKDATGLQWIGKPFVPLGKLQLELFYDALEPLEKRFGIKLKKRIHKNRVDVSRPSLDIITKQLKTKTIEGHKELLETRLKRVNESISYLVNFPVTVKGLSKAFEMYEQAISEFHLRWREGDILDKINTRLVKPFPPKIKYSLMNVINEITDFDIPCETFNAGGLYREILKDCKKINKKIFEKEDNKKIINSLRDQKKEVWRKINFYCKNYLILDYEDMRVPVQYLVFVKRLKKDVLDKDYIFVDPLDKIPDIEEIMNYVKNPNKFFNTLDVTLNSAKLKESEHHYLARIDNHLHVKLLYVADSAQKKGIIKDKYDIFEKRKNEVLKILDKVEGLK